MLPVISKKAIQAYKDWLVSKIIIFLKRKPFYVKTTMDYLILTFRSAGVLPDQIRSLEPFGMYGLFLTKHYSDYCEFVDMWEIDIEYVKYAKRFKGSNVTIFHGDSVAAIQAAKIGKRYNFIMIDNPLISPYGNGLIEHFDLFPQIFEIAEIDFIVIFNVMLVDPEQLYKRYNFISEEHQHNKDLWIETRKIFYRSNDGLNLRPQDYLKIYADKFAEWSMDVKFLTFLPRDSSVGLLGFALTKTFNNT